MACRDRRRLQRLRLRAERSWGRLEAVRWQQAMRRMYWQVLHWQVLRVPALEALDCSAGFGIAETAEIEINKMMIL